MAKFIEFAEFFNRVFGFDPYIWQQELASEVSQSGLWPRQISAPPGAGKSAAMDVAVWALAYDVARHGVDERTLPLRIFWAVERRLVVDSMKQRAQKLQGAIDNDPGLVQVKNALRLLLPNGWQLPSLGVTSLHGGLAPDRAWLRPFGAQIITGTVTQLASRTVFRAVGSSPGMLPVHAALVGTDRVIFIDEPHLVPEAVAMWREAEELQGRASCTPRIGSTVVLGATVPRYLQDREPFTGSLGGDPSPVAKAKRETKKPAVVTVTEAGKNLTKSLVDAAVHAWDNRDLTGGDGVLVVVNTVGDAKNVAAGLKNSLKKTETPEVFNVITSVVRPFDRNDVSFGANALTVATQTVEVGVDLDACALVTELAPMPSLIQRFGRVNRTGRRLSRPIDIIVPVSGESVGDAASRSIYGAEQLAETYETLVASQLDGEIPDVTSLEASKGSWAAQPRTCALGEYLPLLTATRPPAPVPWEALVYGPDHRDHATVQVMWREDLDCLQECPPHTSEQIALPIGELRRFLGQSQPSNASKLEFAETDSGFGSVQNTNVRRQCRVERHGEWVFPDRTHDVRPGEVVVLSSSEGGYDPAAGWNPACWDPVPDHSMRAVCQDRSGAFDASLVLPAQRVSEAVTLEEDLTDEVKCALSAQNLLMDERDRVIVRGRFVVVRRQDDHSLARGKVTLADHATQVQNLATEYARLAGLPNALVEALGWAGWFHDMGKLDARFQAMLGNNADEPVAKGSGSRLETVNGLVPLGWRHEVLSAEKVKDTMPAAELIRHLVLTHHGWGRPLVDHGGEIVHHGDSYRRLERTYGPWGLALLEAVVRCADWEASRHPKKLDVAWSSAVERPVPVFVESAKPDAETPVAVRTEYILNGPTPYSQNGFFAAIGALESVCRNGDPEARICFRGGVARISSAVAPWWDADRAQRLMEAIQIGAGKAEELGFVYDPDAKSVTKKNKWLMCYRDDVMKHMPDAYPFFFSAVNEEMGGEKGNRISAPIFIRNGCPFTVLMGQVSDEVLFTNDTEMSEDPMTGGLDMEIDQRFSGDSPNRYSKPLLAWAIMGMLALGMPPSVEGVGVIDGQLRLPVFEDWLTLAEVQDLVRVPVKSRETLTWKRAKSKLGEKLELWTPILD